MQACFGQYLKSSFALLILVAAAQAQPVEIVPPDFSNPQQPQVAIGADDAIYVTFGRAEEIFLSISRDHARSFSTPKKIGALPKLALGMRRGPRVAAFGSELTITAMSADLFAFHSTDGGLTWSAPTRLAALQPDADSDRSARPPPPLHGAPPRRPLRSHIVLGNRGSSATQLPR